MTPPHFGDFGKKAKDLFKKSYDYKNEIKVTRKAANGVKLESGGYQAKTLVGYTKANWKCPNVGDVEVQAHSSGKAEGSLKLPKLADGVNVTVSGSCCGNVSVEPKYEQDSFALKAKVSHCIPKASTKVSASAVIGFEGVSVGGQVDLDAANFGSPKDYNVGAEYAQKDLIAALVTSNQGNDITASYFQKVSDDLVLGSSMFVQPDKGEQLFTFGGEYKLDKNTVLKSKADSNGIVGSSVTHTLEKPNMKFAVSAQFDALSSDVLCAQKFGVSLSFGDF